MEVFIADSYEAMSRKAADDVLELMRAHKQPLISPATGNSPEGLYRELVNRYHNKEFDISHWHFVGLDEWVGMSGSDEGSCLYNLQQQLFQPLNVTNEQICVFDGKSRDLDKECDRVEKFIHEHGGLNVAIVGLGMNGHIGLNEPGTNASLRSHVVDIHPVTQQVGQKYFKERKHLTKGITLGLATLMEAKHIVLLVNGKHKASIVREALQGDISEQLPASLLRRHRDLLVYLDRDAASEIQES